MSKKKGTKFPTKLHDMLEFAEQEGLDSTISWVFNGRAFMVHDAESIKNILPLFFGQTKYNSLRRQLNNWDFDRVKSGPYKGAFFHPYFVKGNRSLCEKMTRQLFSSNKVLKTSSIKSPDCINSIDSESKIPCSNNGSTIFEPNTATSTTMTLKTTTRLSRSSFSLAGSYSRSRFIDSICSWARLLPMVWTRAR